MALRRFYAKDVVVKPGITDLGRTLEGEEPIGRWTTEVRESWAEVHWEIERIFEASRRPRRSLGGQ